MTWDTVSEPAPPYHWIEEGTPEEFLRNILESDITPLVYSLMGTFTGRIGSNDTFLPLLAGGPIPVEGVPLMGTYCGNFDPAAVMQHAHYVHADMAVIEPQVLAMLLDRPEMVRP